jgi:hypothetical protein
MSRNKVVIEESVVRVITLGIQGPPGLQGVPGEQGPAGEAIAPGGAAGEFLKKTMKTTMGPHGPRLRSQTYLASRLT